MSELSDINAKIDRLNHKLKADPIVVVAEVTPEWVGFWCVNEYTTRSLGSVTMTLTSWPECADALQASRTVNARMRRKEDIPHQEKLFARKIQLAILERLT